MTTLIPVAKPKKTHCKRNHEFTPENTRLDKDGYRVCRACNRERYEKTGTSRRKTHCARNHPLTEDNVLFDSRGRRRGCRRCRDESAARYREANKQYARKSRFLKEYGITVEEYDALYDDQEGKCRICDTPGERYALHLDHCHHQGHVRGLLCKSCNWGLGHFKDDTDLLARAIEYLRNRI